MTDLKGLVKPLEWRLIDDRTEYAKCRYISDRYIIEHRLHGEHFDLWIGHNATTAARFATLEAAKAAANADNAARILAALDLAKVEALVEAVEMMVKAYREESDRVITAFYALEDALAAMKGGDT
jgi:hypothetical protein